MHLLTSVLAAILAIVGIIVLHELGHFAVARWLNVTVVRFSIGFGKALWRHVSSSGIEYQLSILPFGGYVQFLDQPSPKQQCNPCSKAEAQTNVFFHQEALWKRAMIVAAGPMTNFLAALVLYWAVFLIGVTHVSPVIGEVVPGSLAAQSGFHAGET